jgi:hypothetical protein
LEKVTYRGAERSVYLTQYCAAGKIKKNEMGGTCGAYGEERGVHRVSVEKPEGKRPRGRPRRTWDNNIMMDFRKMGSGGNRIQLAQDRDRWWSLLSREKKLWFPYNCGDFLE